MIEWHRSFIVLRSSRSHFQIIIIIVKQGRQFWFAGGRDPRFWAMGVVGPQGSRERSWTGREILLYLIMHRKYMYVRKW